MSANDQFNAFFEQLSKVLLRSWVLGFAMLLIWFIAFLMAREFSHRIHVETFGLSRHEMQLIFIVEWVY